MKILVVSQFYTPDITAAAYRIHDMYQAAKDMLDIDIITSYPHKSHETVKAESPNIYRVNIASKSKNRILRYINEYFGFMMKSIFVSRKLRKQYDFVFATSPPIFTLVSGLLMARMKHARLIIDIRDIWPDVLLDDGTLKEGGLIYKILKRFERYMYKKADLITCVSQYMKQYIKNLSGREVTVIYNGVSEDPGDHTKPVKRRGSKLNLFYIGNIGYYQHLDVLLSCFLRYPRLSEQYNVHLVGGGTELTRFKDMAINNKIQGIRFYGPVEKNEANRFTFHEADVLFLNLHHSQTLEKTIPSKLFDYLSFNLPIVYGVLGEGKEILEKLGCGVFFQWDNEVSLYDALTSVYENYNAYLDDSVGNHDFVCENFDRKKMFFEFWLGLCGEKAYEKSGNMRALRISTKSAEWADNKNKSINGRINQYFGAGRG
jgi:Glycosyltransferase